MKHILLLLLVGCGTEASDTTPDAAVTLDAAESASTSGSRIKAINLVTSDGARHQTGWHDMLRNEECSFEAASDGTRCLPTTLVPHVATYFADAACTLPAVILDPCDPAPKYIGVRNETCTSKTWALVYRVGAPTTTVYDKASGCVASTRGPEVTIYATVELVPLTSFQSATIIVE